MKKTYITPFVEINETELNQMIALSLKDGSADDSEVLTNEDKDWNIWSDPEEED